MRPRMTESSYQLESLEYLDAPDAIEDREDLLDRIVVGVDTVQSGDVPEPRWRGRERE